MRCQGGEDDEASGREHLGDDGRGYVTMRRARSQPEVRAASRRLYVLFNILCDGSTAYPCGARDWLVAGCELRFADRIMEPVKPQVSV